MNVVSPKSWRLKMEKERFYKQRSNFWAAQEEAKFEKMKGVIGFINLGYSVGKTAVLMNLSERQVFRILAEVRKYNEGLKERSKPLQ